MGKERELNKLLLILGAVAVVAVCLFCTFIIIWIGKHLDADELRMLLGGVLVLGVVAVIVVLMSMKDLIAAWIRVKEDSQDDMQNLAFMQAGSILTGGPQKVSYTVHNPEPGQEPTMLPPGDNQQAIVYRDPVAFE